METLIAKLFEYGPFPALLVLTALVGWMIRSLQRNSETDAARSAEFRKALEAQSLEFRKAFESHREDMEKKFAEQADRIACVERDYLPRENHYKDIGGWRTDMNELRNNLGEEIRGVRQDMNALIPSLIKIAMQKGANNGN
jgi:uncharacterized membrane-anchored protein YhcB (DUF1043 family)